MALSFILISSLPIKGMKTAGNVGLLKYKKHTIIQKHINNIISVYPKAEIVVIGGFEHKKLEKVVKQYKRVKYFYHDITETSNETQSLLLGLKNIRNKKAMVLNASCLINKSVLKHIPNSKYSCVFINKNNSFNSNLGISTNDNEMNNIFFNLPNKINNMYFLNQSHINYAKDIGDDQFYNKYMFEFINILNEYEKFRYKVYNSKTCRVIYNNKDYNQIKG